MYLHFIVSMARIFGFPGLIRPISDSDSSVRSAACMSLNMIACMMMHGYVHDGDWCMVYGPGWMIDGEGMTVIWIMDHGRWPGHESWLVLGGGCMHGGWLICDAWLYGGCMMCDCDGWYVGPVYGD